ncbi:hypothetical protein GCM10023264_19310 [Sphingomonas daechungensis]|uniref:hypothetical protein n=1 Tax=Sphingomonas daechungensis TaxID=1176646 RepID=UPI0031E875FB
MRGLAIFLSLFAASLLLFTLGVTTGTNFLLYAGLILFGVLVTGLALRSTSNAVDLGTSWMIGPPPPKDD